MPHNGIIHSGGTGVVLHRCYSHWFFRVKIYRTLVYSTHWVIIDVLLSIICISAIDSAHTADKSVIPPQSPAFGPYVVLEAMISTAAFTNR